MKKYIRPARSIWSEILTRPQEPAVDMERLMNQVFADVKERGDDALYDYTLRFDKVALTNLMVSDAELEEASAQISDDLKHAIRLAHHNITTFHASQRETPQEIETIEGVTCWRRSVPIEKVGLYIPGGTAPLFSTVLMLGIPAKLAGCRELVLCSPPTTNGTIHPAILYAAKVVGIQKIFKVGGSQAIAAMTFGTTTIPKVYKIFGPGNQYVTAAKQYAQKMGLPIDMPAGPSEVLVVADDTANAAFVAADLLSQAEHGIDSQVMFVSLSEQMLEAVEQEIYKQLHSLPRCSIEEVVLQQNSKMILLDDVREAVEFVNDYAPEHLIISCEAEDYFIQHIINAGSVFLGNFTPESAGDYASGTNHTLPTNGYAKSYSGVSLDSFIKKITYQRITEEGLLNLGGTIQTMAREEQLIAHERAVSIRLESLISFPLG